MEIPSVSTILNLTTRNKRTKTRSHSATGLCFEERKEKEKKERIG